MDPETIKNINSRDRKFCDNALIMHGRDIFVIAMITGGEGQTYVLTPSHAKGLLGALAEHVRQFESQFGEINTSPAPVLSPLSSDLSGSNPNKSSGSDSSRPEKK